jgi:hypothetical protein
VAGIADEQTRDDPGSGLGSSFAGGELVDMAGETVAPRSVRETAPVLILDTPTSQHVFPTHSGL